MKITLRKMISGGYVETYERAFDVPKKIANSEDVDVIIDYLTKHDLLDEDWGEEVRFEDTIDDIDYEVAEH
jgi:hypothetical protein